MSTKKLYPRDQLTQERLMQVLHYEQSTGEWTWLISPSNRTPAGSRAGADSDGYRIIRVDHGRYKAHRLAWLYMKGQWPNGRLDHRDCNKGNNSWKNLRVATNSQNQANRASTAQNKSGFKGVSWYKTTNKWVAQIGVNGKGIRLGYFQKAEDAHAAYCEAACRYHGKFARFK